MLILTMSTCLCKYLTLIGATGSYMEQHALYAQMEIKFSDTSRAEGLAQAPGRVKAEYLSLKRRAASQHSEKICLSDAVSVRLHRLTPEEQSGILKVD